MGAKKLPLNKGKHDRKVVAFVNAYWKTKNRAPSIREISIACGISSTCTTSNTLRRLVRSGDYLMVDREARGIVPVWVKNAIEANNPL